MRFLGFIASLNVAMDCVLNAMGPEQQSLFANDMAWLWWPGAFLWLGFAIGFCFWKPA